MTSICTPRALPGLGRNSLYGNDEPTIRKVSQSCIRSQLGLVPSRPERAGHPWQVVRQRRLAEQRLGARRPEPVGDRDHLVGRVQRTGADQHCHLLAGVQHRGRGRAARPPPAPWPRRDSRRRYGWCRAPSADPCSSSFSRSFGSDDAGHAAPRLRDAHRAVDQVPHLLRAPWPARTKSRHVLEQRGELAPPADSARRCAVRACWPMMATTGALSIFAS